MHGPAGVGKSEVALEYCHRFGGGYDIVWWLTADTEQSVMGGLAALADALAIPTAADAADAALRHLDSGAAGSWLLVYDGVGSGEEAPVIVPAPFDDRCHVIVTSRSPGPDSRRARAEVAPFGPRESVALLAEHVPGILPEQAGPLAGRVGHLPLLLDLAGAWAATLAKRLRQDNVRPGDVLPIVVTRFVEGFDHQRSELLAREGAAPAARVMLELSLDTLPADVGGTALRRENIGGATALRLLETCALLSPDGVALSLLRSSAILRLLTTTEKLNDPLMVDVMLRSMDRYGLVQSDLGRPGEPVRMHGLVRELVRDRMGDDTAAALLSDLRLALASWAPADSDDETAPRVYAELERHLDATRPWEDPRPDVRRWLLRQLGHALGREDRLARDRVKSVCLRALAAWDRGSEQTLRLLDLLAQVSRELADYDDHKTYSFEALRAQRTMLGVNHPRTLITAGGARDGPAGDGRVRGGPRRRAPRPA